MTIVRDEKGVSQNHMQIHYKDIIMTLLVTFKSVWLPNLLETSFVWLNYKKSGRRKWGTGDQ